MKKFNYIILSSLALLVLVSSPALLALEGQMATLINDVQELKRQFDSLNSDVQEFKRQFGSLNNSVEKLKQEMQQLLLSLQEGGASPEAAEIPYTQAELLQELLRTVNKGSQAEIDDVIAKLPALGFDINHSASGGRVADAPLYRAIVTGRADEATQEKLVAAGYRLRSVDLAKLKSLSIPLSKAVRDLLAADTGGAAAGAGK